MSCRSVAHEQGKVHVIRTIIAFNFFMQNNTFDIEVAFTWSSHSDATAQQNQKRLIMLSDHEAIFSLPFMAAP